MTDRERILSSLPTVEQPAPVGQPSSAASLALAPVGQPSSGAACKDENEAAWQMFANRLEELGGRVIEQHELQALLDVPRFVDEDASGLLGIQSTAEIWDAEVGVTTAVCAVAETGSVLLRAGPGHHRLASLAPPVHLVLVSEVVTTLAEGLSRVGNRTSVLATGPSRTADIEGVLVRGVHGPGQLLVMRVVGR